MFWSRRQSVDGQICEVYMKNKSLVAPSFLKQKARQIKREKSLSQHQALDEAAMQLGFSNYRNYLNLLEANVPPQPKLTTGEQLAILHSQKEEVIRPRWDATVSRIHNFKMPYPELLESLKRSQHSEQLVQSICEQSPLKDFIELHVLQDLLLDEEGMIHDEAPYHIPKMVSVENLEYRFSDDIIYVDGSYDVHLEFAFEYDKDENSDFFDDLAMFGTFEISIDKEKRISFEDSSIGWNL